MPVLARIGFATSSIFIVALIAACGGGGGSGGQNPTPAGAAPTVAITSQATGSGSIQFSFAFSQDVGNSFTANAVQLSGGSAVVSPVFAKTDATHYSLVVTPDTNASAVNVNVATGAFSNTASIANTSPTSASYPGSSADALACGKAVAHTSMDGRNLVWHDEFCDAQGTGLPDNSKWGYDTFRNAFGWYNGELQYYANARKANSSVAGGQLSINAIKEPAAALQSNNGQGYTSARLITLNTYTFTYGFVEVRAKLPCSQGTWPAIWMLGAATDNTGQTSDAWPAHGEIDIMEQGGFPSGSADWTLGAIHGTVHMPLNNNDNGGAGISGRTNLSDSCTAFHNYQVSWTPNSIAFSVDGGSAYNTYTKPNNATAAYWPFDSPQYLILNVAMGGVLGGTVPTSFGSDSMQVQWVRVYQ
jgi:beta-glucanase (GH16 family)